ncbi:N-(5'-phosphoribosyl)anthranilate isomerase [Dictyobacter arantiisoli]|uniref:N-(5'-phosphoribosyl)anthranilate isomerase n=2 Tax=Dictyobacter arantiisoli TaxID=2014874 RepID=A0A5A5TG69_9CHLR|nr:N-(5'-phosphoribosyl)anthranilate isomerase [Dictyobacter arantiisoli]
MAIRHGASALGLVSSMPSGPGIISEEEIAAIAETIPPPIASFLLTSRQDVPSIVAQQRHSKVNTLQICDRLLEGMYQDLREALPGISLVQVIHVVDRSSVEEACLIASSVDALLLDSGNQSLAIKELGGTGRVHDWELSRMIREEISIPLFLAGGLTPANVQTAIDMVGPFGLDLCSSVRTAGALDEQKLAHFFSQLPVSA